MIYRKFLLVHESPLIRNLLRRYILSQFNDVQTIDSNSTEDAYKIIRTTKLDLIISGFQACNIDDNSLLKVARSSAKNKDIPFIVITSTDSEKNIRELKEAGIKHYLISPVTALDLRSKIQEISNPVRLRRQKRFSLPGIRATVHLDTGDFKAKIINLAKNSLLGELELTGEMNYPDLLSTTYVSVQFPKVYDNIVVREIWCKVMKVVVLSWDENNCAREIQVVWQFLNIPPEEQGTWSTVLERLAQDFSDLATVPI